MYPLDVNFPDAIEFENLPSIDGVWEKVAPALESMYVNMTDAQIAAYNMGMQWKRDVQEQVSDGEVIRDCHRTTYFYFILTRRFAPRPVPPVAGQAPRSSPRGLQPSAVREP